MTVPQQSTANEVADEPGDFTETFAGRRIPRRDDQGDQGVADFSRVPPQDDYAEQAVLGAMQLSKDAIGDVVEVVKPRDFYRPAHADIFRASVDLWSRGEPVDPITLAAELTKRGKITRVGGASYLHTLVNQTPTAANGEYYAEIVRDKAILRRLIESGTRIVQMGYAGEGDVSDTVNAAEAEMLTVVEERADSAGYAFVRDDVPDFINHLQALQNGEVPDTGIRTGFTDLDSLLGGLKPGQLVVVAARPAMGKSTLALDFARSCAVDQGLPAAFFSLEMGRKEIVNRLFSAACRVGLHHINAGTMTEDDWIRIARRTPEITEAPLILDDSPNLTLMEIRRRARRMAQQHDLRLMVVDYLQLVQPGTGKRYGGRQEEVADMSRNLKLLAKELNIPIIALSQLNRGPEQRNDKKPVMSDLRESGAIEQDADVVILLHREDAYEKESPRAGEADLIVCKHRNGPTATVTCAFQGHYSRFVDMAGNV